MAYIKNHRWTWFALAAIVILVLWMSQQWLMLQKAHGTFANYAAFRGCEQITSQTDTSGTCKRADGQAITIVEFHNKWYLQGDLPWACVSSDLCFGI